MSNGSNLEFRKIPSLKFLYEINSDGTVVRNVKSKKQARIHFDTETNSHRVALRMGRQMLELNVAELVLECWTKRNPAKTRVKLVMPGSEQEFDSCMECARFLSAKYGKQVNAMRSRLRTRRSHIYDYDVIYLNAETGHGSFTEQGTVHESDLTGDYKTAFNKGKQQEVEMRVKHSQATAG